ncbi:PSP1 domain-containing protein [Parasphaerochaeta coccoides]|uniref:PSP1 domain protein n=1 Tax=Parasphaerochaeta coccoides (strain ATCC BAA-1237 / DSM 17374 / SPN1) TaxID=760011 RepID=F4GLQ6_PARC1|nr:regulatory iron-sulfur-containing complex subunit RicT [Parasphaerochaeta coccoides]AEC02450.1 PSP1 domain protein [Parasphaerochaeta coccoides DSM 17374]
MKDSIRPVERGSEGKRQAFRSDASSGYLYIVKNPASNETGVFASDSIIYNGTSVMVPTKYGLDLGLVLGPLAPDDAPYVPGCPNCHGACSEAEPSHSLREEEPPAAFGEPEDSSVEDFSAEDSSVIEDVVVDYKADAPDDDGRSPMEKAGVFWDSRPDSSSCGGGCKHVNPAQKEAVLTSISGDVDWVDHIATPSELHRYQEHREMEQEALRVCREKVRKLNLDMKTVAAHYLLGEPKLLFFFTSDVRVDFRALVKELVAVFRLRIELRQIGVRDEARVVGGLAVCGRPYCCHAMNDNLQTVSIKMAKEQNLSLNSMKISGPCGRLLCCLAYENFFYEEARRDFPPMGSRLKVEHDLMKVAEVNVLSRKISLSGPEGRFMVIPREAIRYDNDASRWEVTPEFMETLAKDR